ncbi:hypothetical protein PYCC9005_005930 [Savitreella phatthalungensis]
MTTTLKPLLEASLSPDPSARSQAEQHLAGVSPVDLVDYARQQQENAASRLAALVYLKNYVLKSWSPHLSEWAGPTHACPEEHKHVLRHQIFELAGDNERPVRLQAAFITSKIISCDYPEEWTTVLDDLMGVLARPPSRAWLEGALVVMKDFVEDGMSEEQFVPIAQNLVHHLLLIARDERGQQPGEIRAQAVDIFMSCLDMLEMLTATRRDAIRTFVDRALPPWLETISTAISQTDAHPELRSKAISTILKLRLLFPSQLAPYMPALFWPVFHVLEGLQNEDEFSTRYTGLQVEFIRKAIQAKIIVQEVLQRREVFDGCVALSLKFAQITQTIQDDWEADADNFVEDLEETAFTTRHLCCDLLEDLQKVNSEWFEAKINSLVSEEFAKSESHRRQEALLFLLSSLVHKTDGSDHVLRIALASQNPFLKGRGSIYAAQIGNVASLDTVVQLATSDVTVVRLCAIKALSKFADSFENEVRDKQSSILRTISEGVSSYPASALLMVSETIGPVISLKPSIVLQEQETPLPTLFAILSRNPGDISLTSTVVDIFEQLAGSVDFTALCNAVLPILFSAISGQPELRAVAMDILNGLVEGSSQTSLPDGFVTTLWPMFHMRDLDVEEQQTAHEILRNLVAKAWPQVVAGGHVDDLLDIVARALSTEDESVCAYVPQLLITLLRRAGPELVSQILPQLLKVLVGLFARQPPPSPHFQQGLVQVFASVAASQPGPLVDFLAGLDDSNQALSRVMSAWCEGCGDLHGYAGIRSSIVGLASILATGHVSLNNVVVKGDLIPDTSGRIMTRSRAKNTPDQFTQVSLPVKIVKLLVGELINEQEGNRADEDEEELVSDDEWDQTDVAKVIDEAQLDEAELDRLDGAVGSDKTEDESDPLKDIVTKDYILTFLKQHASSLSQPGIVEALNARERQVLASVIEGQLS